MTEDQERQIFQKSCQKIAADLSLSEALNIIQGAIESSAKESISRLTEEQKQDFYNKLFPNSESSDSQEDEEV